METIINRDALVVLRGEFPPKNIAKLPKVNCWDCTEAGKRQRGATCGEHRKKKCPDCGNYLTTGHTHLDYVGHAETTDRFLDADLTWNWRPMALDSRGLPAFDDLGGMWIWLTIGGVERLGYGSANGKKGPDAIKEVIGDALRNAGMRFGVALNLWARTDLHADEHEPEPPERQSSAPPVDQWSTPAGGAAGAPAPNPPAPAMPSTGQLANLAIGFKERHITDADRLRCTSQLLGREVPSFSTLTLDEYRMVKSALRGGWPYINHVPSVLPNVPDGFEDNPVREILVSGIAEAVSPETLRDAGTDIAKELARGGITRAENVYLRTVYQARTAQLQAGAPAVQAPEPGPAPVGSPDNPGIVDYQRRMLDSVGSRQQHTPAAMVELAQRHIRRDITDLGQLSKAEADRLLHTLTTGEKPAMAGAA